MWTRVGTLVLVVWMGTLAIATAQTSIYSVIYRPPEVSYQVFRTSHFDVIFQEGFFEQAREAAFHLEAHYDGTRSLIGTRRTFRMPVVLNGFNDRSNGYVTPVPFKQEVELTRIRNDGLSFRSDSWLETVMPHELAHAVHGEFKAKFGVGSVLRWFSPDLARAINLGIPPGITEGWAVYYESSFREGSGRLNHSIFNMEFRAAMLSKKPWSLAQMLEAPSYTYPFDRFYNGGAHWVEYLYENGHGEALQKAQQLQNRMPLWGYGVSWWFANKKEPAVLAKSFIQETRTREQERLEDLGTLSQPTVVATATGRIHRRPLWLNDNEVFAYAAGYNLRPGLYRFDVQTRKRTRVSAQRVVGDWSYALDSNKSHVLFARYDPDPFVGIKALATPYRLNLQNRSVQPLLSGESGLAPVEGPGDVLWMLENRGQFTDWYAHVGNENVKVTPWERVNIVSLLPSPNGAHTYVLMNVAGMQGVFAVTFEGQQVNAVEPVILFADASVHQATWSDDSEQLVFTADVGGIPNVYLFDRAAQTVQRLTNAPFGALDPALSPNGQTLAYIDYQHEQYNLVTLSMQETVREAVPSAVWQSGYRLPWRSELMTSGTVEDVAIEGEVMPYRSFRHVKPRSLFPTISYTDEQTSNDEDTELGVRVGLALQGTDPLETWRYNVEGYYQHHRLWGLASVQTGANLLRPSLLLFSEPSTVLARRQTGEDTFDVVRVGREERGVGVQVFTPITLESNVFRSQLSMVARVDYEEERLFDDNGDDLRDFIGRFTFRPLVRYSHRVQSNSRDLVPNTGVIFSVNGLVDAAVEEGEARQALLAEASLYLPFFMQHNIGLELDAGLISQNQGSIYNLDFFMPRGQENIFLGEGTFIRYGAEMTLPLAYIDNGFMLAPLYFRALYAYGFAESLHPTDDWSDVSRVSSVGGGIGLQLRLLSVASLDLRVAYAYRLEAGDGEVVFR